jgi:hypothetical protein
MTIMTNEIKSLSNLATYSKMHVGSRACSLCYFKPINMLYPDESVVVMTNMSPL